MGGNFPSTRLRLSAQAFDPSGRAPRSERYPFREWLDSCFGPGGLFRSSQPRLAHAAVAAVHGGQAATAADHLLSERRCADRGDQGGYAREGVPQGDPLSPVLANVVLDELGWELGRRGVRLEVADKAIRQVEVPHSPAQPPHRKPQYYPGHRRLARDPAWLEGIFRRSRNAEPVARPGQVDPAAFAMAPLEAGGRAGYRELRRHGVSRELTWDTAKSVHALCGD